MGLLKILSILLILIFPIAEVGRVQFSNGIAVSLNDIFLVALLVAWIINVIRTKKDLKRSQLFKSIFVFSVIAFVSLLLNFVNLSVDKFVVSFLYLLRWVSYACLYFIFREFDAKFRQKISYTLLFSGATVVVLGFAQYFFYPSLRNLYYLGWDEHLYRLFSSFLDPNFAGAFFALFFIYVLSFIRDYLHKKEKIKLFLTSLLAVLALGALYLTYSRSALIMLLTGIFVYLFLIKKKKYIFFILLSVLLLIFMLPKAFETEGTNILRATSSDARISTAREALTVIQTNPIYGVGFNAYRFAEQKLGLINGPDWQTTHGGAGTDNSFLFVLATTGIVGMIAFLYLLYKVFSLGWLNLGKNKFSLILIPSLTGLIIGSLFINSLFYVFVLEWIWIMAAFTERI